MKPENAAPAASIVVLNHNGVEWLERCFSSLRRQTIFAQLEVILVDNASTDASVATARQLLADFPMGWVLENKENLGFCEGNNVGARAARGKYVFFLNNDTWLEPECMERLLAETARAGAHASTPLVLDYDDDQFQNLGFLGFDIFGLPSPSAQCAETREIFIPCGCSYLIDREWFLKVGEFDALFFIYSDEVDLSWRVWIAGGHIVGVPSARLHHRGAAGVNPKGGEKVVEVRTTDRKRFLANRNSLLTLMKNGRLALLLFLPPQVFLVVLEALVSLMFIRRWSFFQKTCLDALADCWRMRGHVRAERRRVASFRRRGDFWMLRFFRLPLNRWFEIQRLVRYGFPKVDGR